MKQKKLTGLLEQEYRFLIDRKMLTVAPPLKIYDFRLKNSSISNLKDHLFERNKMSLKEENVGFRIRNVDNKYTEFTYKKFLGKENGMARYDEFTTIISDIEANKLINNNFKIKKLSILKTLSLKGQLYYFLSIENKRRIFNYENGLCTIEMVIEDITYSSSKKSAQDSAMEIEIKMTEKDKESVVKFVEKIKKIYNCIDQNEGKNTRAQKLLKIKLR